MGYSKGLLQQYNRSGWIRLIGKGAYARAETDSTGIPLKNHKDLGWQGGLYALQALNLNRAEKTAGIHVAARTALELEGYAHYLSQSEKQTVWLFSEPGYRVPTWFRKHDWGATVKLYSPKLFSKPHPDSYSKKDWGSFVSIISSPERAIMELLELCPKYESLDHAKLVMENLAGLRSKLVSQLLQNCTSIKVKRLFLALSDMCGHAWLQDADLKNVELGSGKRILESGRALHPKYQVSVPKEEESRA